MCVQCEENLCKALICALSGSVLAVLTFIASVNLQMPVLVSMMFGRRSWISSRSNGWILSFREGKGEREKSVCVTLSCWNSISANRREWSCCLSGGVLCVTLTMSESAALARLDKWPTRAVRDVPSPWRQAVKTSGHYSRAPVFRGEEETQTVKSSNLKPPKFPPFAKS